MSVLDRSIISPCSVKVLIFSFSKITAIPLSFKRRTYCRISTVFLENRDTDFVIITSIFPSIQSCIILWNGNSVVPNAKEWFKAEKSAIQPA